MGNSILDSQYASPNALLTSHGFPVNTSGNALLLSHSPAGVYPNPASGALTLTDGVNFTLNGSFADRADTPFHYSNYEGATVGQQATAVGLTHLGYDTDGAARVLVQDDYAHTGTKSLRVDYPAAATAGVTHPDDDPDLLSCFPQVGVDGLSTDRVYVSMWVRYARHTGTGSAGILKLSRGGANPPYSGNPHYFETWFPDASGVITGVDHGSTDSGGGDHWYDGNDYESGQPLPVVNQWNRLEYYYQLSTAGVANGVLNSWVNFEQYMDMPALMNRLSGNSSLINNIISAFDGNDSYPNGTGWYLWMDQFYVDSTQQRLELGNADTWGACTVREVQPSVTWTTTSITATCQKGGVTGPNAWLYVIAADGTAGTAIPVTLT